MDMQGSSSRVSSHPGRGARLAVPALVIAAAWAAAVIGGQDAPPAAPPTTPPAGATPQAGDDGPARVIVDPDRYRSVPGYVEFEDDEAIFVRDLEGNLERFEKSRLRRLVRLVDPRPGQTGIVVLRNGRIRQGVILEDSFDRVVIEIAGVRNPIARPEVDHVELEPSFEDQYAAFRARISPGMPQRHLELCRWLFARRRYDLAEQELVSLLRSSDLPEARQLLTKVRAQRELDRAAPVERPEARPDEDAPAKPAGARLTPADVNVMRVYEIDFGRPPKVRVDHETIRELVDRYGSSQLIPASAEGREALFKADPLDIVRLMFELKARDLYPRIEVLTEPYALNLFRQRVHDAWLMNNCSTSRCHGGPNAGRFVLNRRKYKDPEVRYANLLMLERFETDQRPPLVNYESPADSLIIEYGLPPGQARHPHPPVRGWRPAFRGPKDRMVRRTIEWMNAMLRPRVDYPVEFEPPAVPEDGAGSPHPRRSR
jgi:hypothetical protein